MTGRVLHHARTFAVLKAGRLLDHPSSGLTSTDPGGVNIRHTDLEHVCDASCGGLDPIPVNVRDNHPSILANAQLRPVGLADADSFLETERGAQPGHGGAHIRVDQHRRYGDRRRRTIGQHGATLVVRRSFN